MSGSTREQVAPLLSSDCWWPALRFSPAVPLSTDEGPGRSRVGASVVTGRWLTL